MDGPPSNKISIIKLIFIKIAKISLKESKNKKSTQNKVYKLNFHFDSLSKSSRFCAFVVIAAVWDFGLNVNDAARLRPNEFVC